MNEVPEKPIVEIRIVNFLPVGDEMPQYRIQYRRNDHLGWRNAEVVDLPMKGILTLADGPAP